MNTQAVLRRAGRIEYALWRMPLTVVDEQVVRRFLDQDAVARRSFERALNAFDDAAVRWLTDPAIDRRATESSVLFDLTELGEPESPVQEESVPEEQVEELAEELLEQEESEPLAGELADNDELRRVQAELNAKRLLVEQQDDHAQR